MPSPDLVPPPSPQDFGNLTSLCAYCSAPSATIDHVRPLARGGLDHPSNRVNACAPCNKEKGARILTELTGNRVWRIRIAHAVQTSLSVAAEYGRLMAQDLINEANRR